MGEKILKVVENLNTNDNFVNEFEKLSDELLEAIEKGAEIIYSDVEKIKDKIIFLHYLGIRLNDVKVITTKVNGEKEYDVRIRTGFDEYLPTPEEIRTRKIKYCSSDISDIVFTFKRWDKIKKRILEELEKELNYVKK